jgi:hypothetical protein
VIPASVSGMPAWCIGRYRPDTQAQPSLNSSPLVARCRPTRSSGLVIAGTIGRHGHRHNRFRARVARQRRTLGAVEPVERSEVVRRVPAEDRVPDEATVALGLVSTKWVEIEDADVLKSRIADAARCHPLERLALAPQCGFASGAETAEERKITEQTQRDKLRLIVDVARAVWPSQ